MNDTTNNGPILNDDHIRSVKRLKIAGFFLIALLLIVVLSVVGYLAWFSYQGTQSNNVSIKFYNQLETGKSIEELTCENNGYLKIKLERYEEIHGKPKDPYFRFSKRKRGERIPESKFLSYGEITRGNTVFESKVEVHRIDGEFKVCAVEETVERYL